MIVCITGMHRSGTSMIARLLNLSGVYLGHESDLISVAADNPEGFWENKNFLDINEEILARFGGSWDTPPVFNEGWYKSDQLTELRMRAQALIDQFNDHENWGWKDSRSSLTIPFWRDLIPDLKVVVCLRNPLEVAQSFYERGYSSTLFSFNLWQSYYKTLLPALSKEEYIVTHYESYFLDSKVEITRLLKFLGISFEESKIEEVCRVGISSKLKHNHSMLEDMLDAKPSSNLTQMYIDMCLQSGEVYWGKYFPFLQEMKIHLDSDKLPEISREGLFLRFSESNRALEKIAKELEEKSSEMSRVKADIRRLNRSEYELRDLQASMAVKALYNYRALTQRLLPESSLRKRIYDFGVNIVRISLLEGPRGFWNRIQARMPSSMVARKMLKSPFRKSTQLVTAPVNENVSAIYTTALAVANGNLKADYVPLSQESISAVDLAVKLIAFYLPQYHPIPENNQWWGEGFTEWTNVSKAVPQFAGHFQPRLPGDLGFYDLRLPQVIRRQVELAKQHGLMGFCFYYYWFAGKRLLEGPLDQFISDPEIDFPFCLCWANENWTRRWDGQESEILIGQEHSIESDFAFIRDIEPYLKHKNYIKVDGRPLLVVYRPQIMPDPVGTARRWRDYCKEKGIGDIYLVAAQTFRLKDPLAVGFDAAVEFPPHGVEVPEITKDIEILNPDYAGKIYNYQHVVGYMMRKPVPDYPLFRTVMTSWDNTARRQNNAHIFINANPQAYQTWLSYNIEYAKKNSPPQERFVFINAWNEWAEGTYLEPDKRYGYAYLQSTMEVLHTSAQEIGDGFSIFQKIEQQHDTAVILHIYYPELWDEICSYLNYLNGQFDLFISIPENVKIDLENIFQRYPRAHIYRCINQGRDIAPFIEILRAVYPLNYRYICKLHTKKTAHRENGQQWRKDLLNKLIGNSASVAEAKKILDSDANVGMLAPKGHLLPARLFMGENEENLKLLVNKAGMTSSTDEFNFIAGSMFWFKPVALLPLILMDIKEEDFGIEQGLKDGTPAHAFERFIGLLAFKNNLKILEIGQDTKDTPRYTFAAPMPAGSTRPINTNPVIVYQVGKVGSRTVFISLQRAYQKLYLNVPVHHVHVLENLDELERNLQKNFANPVDNLAYIRKSKELRRQIERNPKQAWKVISLVRDPIARNVGSFFQNLEEYIPGWREQYDNGSLTLAALQEYFLKNESIHIAADWWFEKQLQPLFGIDVFQSDFPFETGYKIYKSSTSNANLLLIRLENLNSCAERAMYEFLGLKDFSLYNTNVGDEKDYADVYSAFKEIPLPVDYITKMYNTRSAHHFYSQDELDAFTSRWLTDRNTGL